jgi:hypothetical protein
LCNRLLSKSSAFSTADRLTKSCNSSNIGHGNDPPTHRERALPVVGVAKGMSLIRRARCGIGAYLICALMSCAMMLVSPTSSRAQSCAALQAEDSRLSSEQTGLMLAYPWTHTKFLWCWASSSSDWEVLSCAVSKCTDLGYLTCAALAKDWISLSDARAKVERLKKGYRC